MILKKALLIFQNLLLLESNDSCMLDCFDFSLNWARVFITASTYKIITCIDFPQRS